MITKRVISSIAPKSTTATSAQSRLSGDGIGLADFYQKGKIGGRGQVKKRQHSHKNNEWPSVGTTQKYAASWETTQKINGG